MVFSVPNLVFTAHVAFSLIFCHLSLLYKFYSVCRSLLFGPFFHRVFLLLYLCAARHFGLVFHLYFSFTLCGPCFFWKHTLLKILQFALLNPHSLLIIFSFRNSYGLDNFRLYLFVCSSMF